MRMFAIDFMKKGKRVNRIYVSAYSEQLALALAGRKHSRAYDRIIASEL